MTTTPIVQNFYDGLMAAKSLAGFTINATKIPPDYTLTSTATLSGAQFSHNNFTLECLLLGTDQPLSDTIVTAGTRVCSD